MDTCYALATSRGKAGVAIIRISGPNARDVRRIIPQNLPDARVASVRRIINSGGDVIDEALVLYFPKGQSFTGEDVVEIQTHGSLAIVDAVLRELSFISGFRLADAGEFTRRALLNGRLDMTQVEGLGDLIEAETEAQRRQAMRVFSGSLGSLVTGWRKSLIRALALIEATIDFADEDVPVDVSPEVLELINSSAAEMRQQLVGVGVAERVRDGFEVAIIGVPNAGKSTLFNKIADRDAAIVSDVAGTTRDIIEVKMDLNGLPVTFLDTAGLRDAKDAVEEIGISRAKERAAQADLRVFLRTPDEELPLDPREEDFVYLSKSDVLGASDWSLSGKTGEGVSGLLDRISERFEGMVAQSGSATKDRHRQALIGALSLLDRVSESIDSDVGFDEMVAEDLRLAIQTLDVLIGHVDVENVLDEIFSSFCLGK